MTSNGIAEKKSQTRIEPYQKGKKEENPMLTAEKKEFFFLLKDETRRRRITYGRRAVSPGGICLGSSLVD